jgi:prevent-host-death family protein
MGAFTVTSREFNQEASRIKKAARNGPVFITERGKPAHVLMTVEEYERLANKGRTLADLFGDLAAAEVEFELPPRQRENTLRIPDFSDDAA